MEMKITILKHVLSSVLNPFTMGENVDSYVDYVATVISMVDELEEESWGYTPLVLDCIACELDAIMEMAKVKCPSIRHYWNKLEKMLPLLDVVTDDTKTPNEQKEAVNTAQLIITFN